MIPSCYKCGDEDVYQEDYDERWYCKNCWDTGDSPEDKDWEGYYDGEGDED